MKNDRGEITIPMIITVIILIILAGICIFMLTGENGVFIPKKDSAIENTNNVNTNSTTDEQQGTNDSEQYGNINTQE